MARRIFSREFKVEAVRLVRERGVTVAQACRRLSVKKPRRFEQMPMHRIECKFRFVLNVTARRTRR